MSLSGAVAGSATEPVSLNLLPEGGAEQDPAEWWSAITAASRRVMAESGVPSERVVAVACTAQWAGTVAADESGEPLCPAVIWMDSRGNTAIRRQVRGKLPVLGIGASKLGDAGQVDRRRAEPFGQGPRGPHPLAPRRQAGRLRGDPQVPGAGRLGQPAADRPLRCFLRLDRSALVDRQPEHRLRPLRLRPAARSTGSTARSSPISGRRLRSSARCSVLPPSSSGSPKGSRSRRGPAISTLRRSARARSRTSTHTSTSELRRGSRATSRTRRLRPPPTSRPSLLRSRAVTSSPTSTRPPARA